jgi:hypothetical protein
VNGGNYAIFSISQKMIIQPDERAMQCPRCVRRPVLPVLSLSLIAAAAAPLGAQARSGGPSRAGNLGSANCYRIELGPWTPRGDLGEDSIFTFPPRRIAIRGRPDSATAADSSESIRPGRVARALERRPGSVHSDGGWHVIRKDSVELIYTTGFSGVVLYLRPEGTGWRGVAETFWDFPRGTQRADAVLTRTTCER